MIRGSCLCRGVTFELHGRVSPIGHCHCSKCRKVSGTGSNAVLYLAKANLKWLTGGELIRTYAMADGWATTFCSECGSNLPQLDRKGKIYYVPAGALDDDPGVRAQVRIFVGSKAPWEEIHGPLAQYMEGFDSPRLAGAEQRTEQP